MGNNVDTSRGRAAMAEISDVDKDGYITTKEATMALMGDGHLTDDEVAFIAAVKAMSIMGGKVKKEKLLAYLDAIDRIEGNENNTFWRLKNTLIFFTSDIF